MKRVCKHCGGELYVIEKPFTSGTGSHAHFYCKECKKHNQFCPKGDMKLYEIRESEEKQEFLPLFVEQIVDKCGLCHWFKDPKNNYKSFCTLTGEKQNYLSPKCKHHKRIENARDTNTL